MKRLLMISALAAIVLTGTALQDRADAAPVQAGGLSGIAAATDLTTPVHYRGRGYYRPGFALYLGGPGPRCWWSHRWHRRVCSYY